METLDSALQALMGQPPYDQGRWGLFVKDVKSGEILARREPTTPFMLGSTTKIFSVTAALERLGPDLRFETDVVRTGEIRSGVLAGDLILVANGDLTLGGRTRADGSVDIPDFDHTDANAMPGMATLTSEDPLAGLRELARQVRAAGIQTVDGSLLIDDRLWDTFDLARVPISPIVVNDNL